MAVLSSKWRNQVGIGQLLPYPLRMLVIGSSETGKTFLVRKMLLRGDLGPKNDLEILVFAPCESSRQQPIYKDLVRRGWNITIFSSLRKAVESKRILPRRLLIVDDVDGPAAGKGVMQEATRVFTTESHHANYSCIMISHHLRTGSPILRGSAPFVLLTAAPSAQLLATLKDLDAPADRIPRVIEYLLQAKTKEVCLDGGLCRHHIVLSRSPGTYPLWTIPDTYCGPAGITPWEL